MLLQAGDQLVVDEVDSSADGPAGEITLRAGQNIWFQSFDSSSRRSDVGAAGRSADAGDVTVVSGGSLVVVPIVGDFSTLIGIEIAEEIDTSIGNGGDIWLQAADLTLRGARLTTEVVEAGTAGDIVAIATGAIRLQDAAQLSSTVQPTGSGQGGNIRLQAPLVELTGSSWLNTSTLGLGDAGNIQIDAGTLRLRDSVAASATSSQGNAGSVRVRASGAVQLDNTVISIKNETICQQPSSSSPFSQDWEKESRKSLSQVGRGIEGEGRGSRFPTFTPF